jgi:lipopolysaccharide biosynthesis regulator YciM
MIETEAFAKILIRQGKTDKAIDVYQKLILRNPEKRNYFAKKLSELYRSEH